MTNNALPVVVFLHGYLEGPTVWRDFIGEYFADCQVFTPALPGYGANHATEYSLEAAAESVRAELEAAGVGRAVLVGHSMGGYVALAFAEKYPGLVAGLSLFHSSALPDGEQEVERRARNRTFLQEQGVAAFAAEFLKPQLSPVHRESLTNAVEQLQALAAAVPLVVALANLDAMAQRPDRRAVLEQATYPVLFIAGKDDRAVPPEKTHEESLLPDYCTVVWLAGVGHLGFIERPADTRRAVRQLIDAAFAH